MNSIRNKKGQFERKVNDNFLCGEDIYKCGLYKITNILNKKVYVGSTSSSFISRWNKHLFALRKGNHSNMHLQNSFNKHKESVFKFEILEVMKKDKISILNREEVIIASYDFKKLYNIKKHTGEMTGVCKFSVNQCKNISEDFLSGIVIGDLCKKYKTNKHTVSQIINGKYYNSKDMPLMIIQLMKNQAQFNILNASKSINKKNRSLTKEQAIEVLKLCRLGEISQDKIAEMYNTNVSTVRDIYKRRTYLDFTNEYFNQNRSAA